MFKHFKSIFAVGLALALTGCSPASTADQENNQAAEIKKQSEDKSEVLPVDEGEKVQIRIISPYTTSNTDSTALVFNEALEEAKAEFPDYEIIHDSYSTEIYKSKLKIAMASSEDFDIFFSWSDGYLKPMVENDFVLPLNDLLTEYDYDLEKTDCWSGMIFDDEIYGVATSYWLGVLYYNPYIFNQFHIEVPQTWDELVEACRTLSDNGLTPFSLGMKDIWPGHVFVNQLLLQLVGSEEYAKIAAGESHADREIWLEIGEKIQELIDAGAFADDCFDMTNDDEITSFLKGYRGMMLTGSIYGIDKDNDYVAVTSFPLLEDCNYPKDYLGKSSSGFCISADTEFPEESFEVMMYLVDKCSQDPTLLSVWKEDEEQDNTSVARECLKILDEGEGWGVNYDVLLAADQKDKFLEIVMNLFTQDSDAEKFADDMTSLFSE